MDFELGKPAPASRIISYKVMWAEGEWWVSKDDYYKLLMENMNMTCQNENCKCDNCQCGDDCNCGCCK
jgi:hypothetical protein